MNADLIFFTWLFTFIVRSIAFYRERYQTTHFSAAARRKLIMNRWVVLRATRLGLFNVGKRGTVFRCIRDSDNGRVSIKGFWFINSFTSRISWHLDVTWTGFSMDPRFGFIILPPAFRSSLPQQYQRRDVFSPRGATESLRVPGENAADQNLNSGNLCLRRSSNASWHRQNLKSSYRYVDRPAFMNVRICFVRHGATVVFHIVLTYMVFNFVF